MLPVSKRQPNDSSPCNLPYLVPFFSSINISIRSAINPSKNGDSRCLPHEILYVLILLSILHGYVGYTVLELCWICTVLDIKLFNEDYSRTFKTTLYWRVSCIGFIGFTICSWTLISIYSVLKNKRENLTRLSYLLTNTVFVECCLLISMYVLPSSSLNSCFKSMFNDALNPHNISPLILNLPNSIKLLWYNCSVPEDWKTILFQLDSAKSCISAYFDLHVSMALLVPVAQLMLSLNAWNTVNDG